MPPSAVRNLIIYDRPIYTRGSGPPLMPVTLAPPNESTGWFIAEKIRYFTDDSRAPLHYYIVSPLRNRVHRQAVVLQNILDWVSPKNYEDFEFDFRNKEEQLRLGEGLQKGRKTAERKDIKLKSVGKPRKRRRRRFGSARASIEKGTLTEWSYLPPKADPFGLLGSRPVVLIDDRHDGRESVERLLSSPRSSSLKRKRSRTLSDATTRDIDTSLRSTFQPSLSDSARKLRGLLPLPRPSLPQRHVANSEIRDEYDDLTTVDELETSNILNPIWPIEPRTGSLQPLSYSAVEIPNSPSIGSDRSHTVSCESGSPTQSRTRLCTQEAWDMKRRASLTARASPYFDSSHDDDPRRDFAQPSPETSNTSSSLRETLSTSGKPFVDPASGRSATSAKSEQTGRKILAHEFRIVKNKRSLFYLVGSKTDPVGRQHVSWEPEELVNSEIADVYVAQLNGVPMGTYDPSPAMHSGPSDDADGGDISPEADGEDDSPTDQLLDDLAIDHYTTIRSQPATDGVKSTIDIPSDHLFGSPADEQFALYTNG